MIILRQSEFSKKDNKKKKRRKIPLSRIDSHAGLFPAIITAPVTANGSLVGGYYGKHVADSADEEGLRDADILEKAGNRGGLAGAGMGAVSSGIGGALTNVALKKIGFKLGTPIQIANVLGGTALGYIGGREAARYNTKARLRERALREINKDYDYE